MRQTLVANLEQGGEREPTACGVTRDREMTRLVLLIEKPAVRREAVVHRARVRILRRQPVVDVQHSTPDGLGQVSGELAVSVGRPEDVAAAVHVLEHAVFRAAFRVSPNRGDAAGVDRCPRDARWVAGRRREHLGIGALLRKCQVSSLRHLRRDLANQVLHRLSLLTGHVVPL